MRSVLVVFAFFFLLSCNNDMDKAKLVTSRANVNIEHGKDIEINYSSLGDNKIKAFAKTMLRFNTDKPYMEFPDGIKINFSTKTEM